MLNCSPYVGIMGKEFNTVEFYVDTIGQQVMVTLHKNPQRIWNLDDFNAKYFTVFISQL